jgi:hypothetical protein
MEQRIAKHVEVNRNRQNYFHNKWRAPIGGEMLAGKNKVRLLAATYGYKPKGDI